MSNLLLLGHHLLWVMQGLCQIAMQCYIVDFLFSSVEGRMSLFVINKLSEYLGL